MSLLWSLLIVAAGPLAPTVERYPEAAQVFHCQFGPQWDQNYDNWPDNWSRRRGPSYPRYLSIRLSAEASSPGTHCLRVDLDGGGAVACSPPIDVDPAYDYVLEGLVQTEGLQHDRAWLSLTFLDQEGQRLVSFASESIGNSEGWKKLRLEPVAPGNSKAVSAIIGLHLEPTDEADLSGVARFDDLWLARLPHVDLSTAVSVPFFTDPKEVTITCDASGFEEPETSVTFQLEDAWGKPLANQQRRLKLAASTSPSRASSKPAAPRPSRPAALAGSALWQPPVPGPGFYRVVATMKGRQSPHHRPEVALVVLEPQSTHANSEFGWTLPRGNRPLPLPQLADLVCQSGVGWVKYPLWYDEKTLPTMMDGLIQFTEQLDNQGVQLVGLLVPPPSLCRKLAHRSSLSATEVFALSADQWYPTVELTLARMATQVRWWQLGDDCDTSFVADRGMAEKISLAKQQLDRIGHGMYVGVGWSWKHPLPQVATGQPPWQFLALSADPPFAPDRLASVLAATRDKHVGRWVVVEPNRLDGQALDAQVADLVAQIMAAKTQGAEGIFLADPFDRQHGVMNADGTPGPLFLPWRTTALMLGGAGHVGSIELPGASQNHLFARPSDAVMVVWNEKPAREVVYLGHDVHQVDLWGRKVTPPKQDGGQAIEVGPMPTFLVGLDMAVTRWRQEFSFAKSQLPSIPGVRHENTLRIKNPLDREIVGKLHLVMPEGWLVDPPELQFNLQSGQSLEQPLGIILPDQASCGRQRVRGEYEIQADPPVRFSVYRELEVGLGDVTIEATSRLDESGELVVEQVFTNNTDQRVTFRCQLFIPEQRRQSLQIVALARGEDRKTYRVPDGTSLLGKPLWIRAVETNGPRVLNYRFVARE